ncbi:MAG: GatB/YqeY domain-containing protein [Bacteroidales bacterium]|nr:GatB/YqeY domain-containing protein [Bacteroidales bacterium]
MSLEIIINDDIKQAMRNKESRKLAALRDIKAKLLLVKTGKDVSSGEIPETVEMSTLQKLVKQRVESADIYKSQGREDLAEEELFQAEIIKAYLPKQYTKEELTEAIKEIIAETGVQSMKEMGKVMGVASQKFAGKADNKMVSAIVKELLG